MEFVEMEYMHQVFVKETCKSNTGKAQWKYWCWLEACPKI